MREKEIERKSEGERVGDAAPETVAARASFRVAGRAEEVLYIGAKG